MPCKYNDCGWCYAPEGVETTSKEGACHMMQACPQSTELPPINQPVLQSAYNFYSTDTYNKHDTGEDDADNQGS